MRLAARAAVAAALLATSLQPAIAADDFRELSLTNNRETRSAWFAGLPDFRSLARRPFGGSQWDRTRSIQREVSYQSAFARQRRGDNLS
jgi:hypothetical protein